MKKTVMLFIGMIYSVFVLGQFPNNPETNLRLTGFDTYHHEIGLREDGNFYLAYNAPSGDDIFYYLMYFDKNGNPLWDQVKTVQRKQTKQSYNTNTNLHVDKEGNAIMVCPHSQYDPSQISETYTAYKIDVQGNDLWGKDGVNIMGEEPKRVLACMDIVQLTDGSYVFVWLENTEFDPMVRFVRMQRVSGEGDILWGEGKRIEKNNASVSCCFAEDAGKNEFIVVYAQGPQQDIYASKIDFEGNSVWEDPVLVHGKGGLGTIPLWTFLRVVPAEGGVLVGWYDDRSGSAFESTYLSYVKNDGTLGFSTSPDGLKINHSETRSFGPEMAFCPETRRFYVVWRETNRVQSMQTIVSQLVTLDGELLWNSAGTRVCPVSNRLQGYYSAQIGSSGKYAAFFMTSDPISQNVSGHVYLQDNEGRPVWKDSSVCISSFKSQKGDLIVSGFMQNQWICVWSDKRNSSDLSEKESPTYVYGQNIRIDGSIGSENVSKDNPEPLSLGIALDLYPNPVYDKAFLRLQSPTGGTFEITVFDLSGRQIGECRKEQVPAGRSSVQWQKPFRMPAGVYVLRASLNGETVCRKMIVR